MNLHPFIALPASVLAGITALGGFSPWDHWWLSLMGWFGLFFLWVGAQPRRAVLLGLFFGMGYFGVGISWVHISIHQFGGTPLPLAVLLAALLAFYCALFMAAAGWLAARFYSPERAALSALLAVSAVLAFDMLRGWLFTGFPWLSPGYALIDSPLNLVAPIFGVYGLSFVGLAMAALLAAVMATVIATVTNRLVPSSAPQLTVGLKLGAAAAVVVLLLASLWNGPVYTQASGEPVSVALIQGSVGQEDKWAPEQFGPTMQRYQQLTLANSDADVIIWPEVAVPGWYSLVDIPWLQPLRNALSANKSSAELLLGVLRQDEQGRYYNSVVDLHNSRQRYDKRHLVPFGEYTPFGAGNLVRRLLGIELPDFSSGDDDQPLVTLAGSPWAITICYENVFGHEFRKQIAAASVIANVSNDGWFGQSLALPQHLQMARFRAMESQKPLLRATNTGITASIEYNGEIDETIPADSVAVLRAEVQPRLGKTPYVKWGDWPLRLLVILVILAAICLLKSNRFSHLS